MQRPLFPRVFRTLRARLLFWILAVVVPIYALATWLSYESAATRLENYAVARANELAERLAGELDAAVRPIQGAVRTVAFQLEETNAPQARYLEHIRGVLGAWPEVYGSTIAVEVDGTGGKPFAPYLYRRDGRIMPADLSRASYGYSSLPWYRAAADSGAAVWSAPYFDKGGGEIWMITHSAPFFRRGEAGRVLAGVVTADLALDWMRRTLAKVQLGRIGLGWISSGSGAAEFTMPVGDTEQRLRNMRTPPDGVAVRATAATMLAQGRSFGLVPKSLGRAAYVAVSRIGALGWNLTLFVPQVELLDEARAQLRRQIELGAIGLAVLVLAITLVAAGIARPLHALAVAVGRAEESDAADLHFNLPESSRADEIGVLTRALARLRDSLQLHVRLRAESLATQARLDHELEVSAQIQQSMLPHGDAIHAVPAGIEIAATLIPARQVGGDLYEYFPVPDGRLLFAVGDVSDKGIPAALFMARMSALMRVLGAAGSSPERLLGDINSRLVEGNDACMFVTIGCGLLDPQSGEFSYASAGHDPPLLRFAEGEVREVAGDSGPAVGIDAGTRYPLQQGRLAPGDSLLLYTDGLSEAEAGGAQFGVPRLAALLGEAHEATPVELVERILGSVASYTAGATPFDDLTVMVLRFNPPDVATRVEPDGVGWLLSIEPSQAGLWRAHQRLCGILAARGVSDTLRHDLELVVEELLTNALTAAGNTLLTQFSLDIVLGSSTIRLTFRDDGTPFNPLAAGAPDLELDISERPVGGLGLHLVRQTAKYCEYTRASGCNVLDVLFARN